MFIATIYCSFSGVSLEIIVGYILSLWGHSNYSHSSGDHFPAADLNKIVKNVFKKHEKRFY